MMLRVPLARVTTLSPVAVATGSLVIHSATSNDIGDAHPVHNGNTLGPSGSEQRSPGIPNFQVADPLHAGEHKEELYATFDTSVDPKWESGWSGSEDNTSAGRECGGITAARRNSVPQRLRLSELRAKVGEMNPAGVWRGSWTT